MQIRILKNSEISFLKEMLYEAIFIPEGMQKPPKSIINDQSLAHYYENWGKDIYDIALVIEIDGEFIGAIWGRKFFIKEKCLQDILYQENGYICPPSKSKPIVLD